MSIESVISHYRHDPIIEIVEKALAGNALDENDGIELFKSNNLFLIGAVANELRKRRAGDIATFSLNMHINYTNICVSKCAFCAYYREKGQKGAYTLSLGDIMEKVEKAVGLGATDLHIVGSHHPDLPFEFYEEMISSIKKKYPNIHIQAFTAAEIKYFSDIFGLSIEEILRRLKSAGLDSMPGGGAEIFNEELRKKICPRKASAEEWIMVMKKAHSIGIKSNATMLFGHVESYKDRVRHLLILREAQEESKGFQAFVPLPFHPENTALHYCNPPSGFDILKTIAISRIILDGIHNIKAYWVMMGEKLAQIALHYGANDLEGTVIEERIARAAAAPTQGYIPKERLIEMIKSAGMTPVQRTSTYKIIRVFK